MKHVYVESYDVSQAKDIPADQRNGTYEKPYLSPDTAITKSGGENIKFLLKCGSTFRSSETLIRLTGRKNIHIKPYASQNVEDCDDNRLPAIRSTQWVDTSKWIKTKDFAGKWPRDNLYHSNGSISSAGYITLLLQDLIPLQNARHPNNKSNNPYSEARAIERLQTESISAYTDRAKKYFKVSPEDEELFKSLNPNEDLVNARIHIRTEPFIIERAIVTAYDQVTGIMTVSRDTSTKDPSKQNLAYPVKNKAGYYLEGKAWMLDTPGEWVAHSDDNIYYMSSTAPARLEANRGWFNASIDNSSGITIERIRFDSSYHTSIEIRGSTAVNIRGVTLNYPGSIGIVVDKASTDVSISGSRVTGAGSCGIHAPEGRNTKVNNNQIIDTGRISRPKTDPSLFDTFCGIRIGGSGSSATGNVILNSAGTGLHFENFNSAGLIVDGNTVVNSCILLSDCGSIYTSRKAPSPTGTTEGDKQAWLDHFNSVANPPITDNAIKVKNNLIVGNKSNTQGCRNHSNQIGSTNACPNMAYGIYLDDYTGNVNVENNKVIAAETGIYLHNAAWNRVQSNKITAATHASLLVNQDAKDNLQNPPPFEIMRGNQIRENTFISRRAFSNSGFSESTPPTSSVNLGYIGTKQPGHTYAQLWLHASDPSWFFKENEARAANVVQGNTTLSLTKTNTVAAWRMGPAGQLIQSSGAVWGVKRLNDATVSDMSQPAWQTMTASGDTEFSPVSYKPMTQKAGSNSLVDDFVSGTSWEARGFTFAFLDDPVKCVGAVQCVEAVAKDSWNAMASKALSLLKDEIYLGRFTVRAGPTGGAFNGNIQVDGTWVNASREYIQSTYLRPDESRQVEFFFRAAGNDPATKWFIKPSDATTPFTNRKMYFSQISLLRVNDFDILPFSTLSATAVNASTSDRSVWCSDLGLGNTCPLLVDEFNEPIPTAGGAITLPPGSIKQIYVRSDRWSDN